MSSIICIKQKERELFEGLLKAKTSGARLGVILGQAAPAVFVRHPQIVHSIRTAGCGCFAVPADGLHCIVLPTGRIAEVEISL